ncbi:translation initiation factor IF-3, mitochondrial-like [Teleopsis dalmanni]|uniref:translation initiation factor IF-3, mitochondrial-like n=1 Tax=Teleopsis dalmanni TaxID=139649 RepID=UPI0018CDA93E|nr:translation initiation factor IF-3, mitochondrial-like [Teleopsis dalmanni]
MSRILLNGLFKLATLHKFGFQNIVDAKIVEKRNFILCVCLQEQKINKDATNNANPTKKAKSAPKITLMGPNDSISVTTLGEAQKLAKRRDLHIMQLEKFDSKTQRPIYKLVTSAEMLKNEMSDLNAHKISTDKNLSKKSEKSLTIGSRISEHDLGSRLKNISKWLAKQHEVRVLIQGNANENQNSEKIFKSISESITNPDVIGKIVQKHTKGSVTKFSIIPQAAVTQPPVSQSSITDEKS